MPVFNFLKIPQQVLDGVISPPEKESLKYSPKLHKIFVNADQNPLSKNFHISPLRRTSVITKQFIWDFSFSKPVNLGMSVRKTNRRSRNKQRPVNFLEWKLLTLFYENESIYTDIGKKNLHCLGRSVRK